MKKKPRRVVLGEGYPVFTSLDKPPVMAAFIGLEEFIYGKHLKLPYTLLEADQKILLIAEILDPHGKG